MENNKQPNREKVLIRLLRDIREYQLTTSDLKFLKDNIERIWVENLAREQILKFKYNDKDMLKLSRL